MKMIGISDPDGIYKFDGGEWKPWNDELNFDIGAHVIYFDNRKCFACRIYDFEWFPVVASITEKNDAINFWVILCDWFANECESKAASIMFKRYKISASPTTLFILNGEVKRKVEGIIYANKLKNYINELLRLV